MKKFISLLLAVLLLASMLALPASAAGSAELSYTLTYADENGNEYADLSHFGEGDTVTVEVKLARGDVSGSYSVYGLEFTFMTRGLAYGDDGEKWGAGVGVHYEEHRLPGGEDMLSFPYYDTGRTGVEISNPITVAKCTYTISDAPIASLRVSTALVYITGDSNNPYVPAHVDSFETCRHEKTSTSYENVISGEDGTHNKIVTCDKCGKVLSTAEESCVFDSRVTKKATCTTNGERTYTCRYCGNSYTETIRGGHDYSDKYEHDETEHWLECTVCGKEKPGSREEHDFNSKGTCKTCGYGCDHDFKSEVVKKPTETETGLRRYTCRICGYTYTEKIPALGKSDDSEINENPRPVDAPELNKADHVNYLMGYTDGTIRPNANITRAEAATIFFRLLTDESRAQYMTSTSSFSDVPADAWYTTAVATLSRAGIINGYTDGTFRPGKNITRAEMATIIAKFADLTGTGSSFTDIAGHWAKKNIETAVYNGWINGYTDGTFRPDRNITRAETVAMINRVLGRGVDSAEQLASGMNTWSDNLDTGAWYYLHIQEASNNHSYEKIAGVETWSAKLTDVDWAKYQY